MSIQRYWFAAVVFVPSACVSSAPRVIGTPSPIAAVAALDARLPGLLDSAGIPGMAATILAHGVPVSHIVGGVRTAASGGGVTSNTVFEAASLSKPLIGFMTLKLVDQGRLALDQPLSSILPLDGLDDSRSGSITARMVLSHRTGLQNERIGEDRLALAFDPGTSFRYSGEAYTYLGHVIEKITGQPLDVAARNLVFDPFGMTRSSFVWEERFADDAASGHGQFGELRSPSRPSVPRGAATLHTTADDYARFMSAVALGRGLSATSRAAVRTAASDVASGVQWTQGWALELRGSDSALWHHGDNSRSGFTAFAWLDARTGSGIVYLANSTLGLSIVDEMLDAVRARPHPSADWIKYERFDSPARLARMAIYSRAVKEGSAAALSVYHELKARGPEEAFGEGLLNALGYRFLDLNRPADATLLFEENVRAFPSSANVYDSLGDGLAAAGRHAEAVSAYRRSVALDPRNTHALEMIRKLER